MADLLGRKRIFLVGLTLFTLASLVCGLAGNIGVLIGARAVQGIGAAIISPAALSIVTTTFREGAERNKALGIWGAIAGIGGAAGVLFGGVLTDTLGWEWIFFVNVPVGLAVMALVPRYIEESRSEGATRNFDVAGAITGTAGLSLLVYALVNTDSAGWASGETIGLMAGAVALLAAFILAAQVAQHRRLGAAGGQVDHRSSATPPLSFRPRPVTSPAPPSTAPRGRRPPQLLMGATTGSCRRPPERLLARAFSPTAATLDPGAAPVQGRGGQGSARGEEACGRNRQASMARLLCCCASSGG
jgi:MFS family permease